MIMLDERNFRIYYYDKFGIGGVEERKFLEILLKEKLISVEKLKQFCLRFAMLVMYRNYVWKLILGEIYRYMYIYDVYLLNINVVFEWMKLLYLNCNKQEL